MNKQTMEQIRFIENILRGHEEKSQKAYYSIKIERFGEFSLVVDRGYGADAFLLDIANTAKIHKPDQIVIELYSTKSKRVKYPTNTYKLEFDKRAGSQPLTIIKPGVSGTVDFSDHAPQVQPQQEFISIQQYIQESLQSGRMQMQLEFQVKTLEFDNRQKDAEILRLKTSLEEQKQELDEVCEELERQAKQLSKGGLGSVTLGSVGSSLLEHFVRSKTAHALTSALLGPDKAQVLQGVLKGIDQQENGASANDEAGNQPSTQIASNKQGDRVVADSKTPSKRFEEFRLPVLQNVPRFDALSREEQLNYLSNMLEHSDQSVMLVFGQIMIALQHAPQLTPHLGHWHKWLVEQFNAIQPRTQANSAKPVENRSADRVIDNDQEKDEPDEDSPDDSL